LAGVLILVGPTASGKTSVALTLAEALNGEIISADSRQIYKFLDVGTAKPSRDDCLRVRHYFIDEKEPDEEFNAAEFGSRGRVIIDGILRRHKTPIVVGGSGLYVRSLVDGLFEGPGADREFRKSMESRIRAGQIDSVFAELKEVDPVAAERADPTKPRRIIRALEVYHQTGKPLSAHQKEQKALVHFMPVMFGLTWEREVLYRRIEERCDDMIAAGLLQEVENLEKRGYNNSLNALNTVGYAEAFAYRQGSLSYAEFVRLFKQNSRRYAKRQLTWFRKDPRIHWIQGERDTQLTKVSAEIARLFKGSCS
jgi:tRNA dimethylallyltransferase